MYTLSGVVYCTVCVHSQRCCVLYCVCLQPVMMVMGGLWPLVDPGSLLYRILKVGDPPMHPLSVLMLSFLPPPSPFPILYEQEAGIATDRGHPDILK